VSGVNAVVLEHSFMWTSKQKLKGLALTLI